MSLSFAAAAREAPRQVAIVSEEGVFTYGELGPVVAQTVVWLEEQISPSSRSSDSFRVAVATDQIGDPRHSPPVALVGAHRLSQLVAIFALLEAGIPFLLLHPRWRPAERLAVEKAFGPRLVIDSEWRWPLDLLLRASEVRVDDNASPTGNRLGKGRDADLETGVITDSRTLAVVFTSGSSGVPKGAVLSRRAVVASAASSAANLGWQTDDRWLLSLPVAHVGGLSVVTRALVARRAIVVPEAGGFDESAFIEVVENRRVTLASLVPTQLYRLLERRPEWNPPAHLRAVLIGGDRAPQGLVERGRDRGWPLLVTYGLTEGCSQVATQSYAGLWGLCGEAESVPPFETGEAAPPLNCVEIRIRGSAGTSEGGAGAIELRGPMLFDGYLVADRDADVRVDVSGLDRDGWFSTGDLGRLDSKGRLTVAGRGTDLVISGGENVYPGEVEAVLEQHPQIVAACVFGIEGEEWGQSVAAAAVSVEGTMPSRHELTSYFEHRLAGHRRPRWWLWLDQLDTAPSGKVDRRKVRDRALEIGLERLV